MFVGEREGEREGDKANEINVNNEILTYPIFRFVVHQLHLFGLEIGIEFKFRPCHLCWVLLKQLPVVRDI